MKRQVFFILALAALSAACSQRAVTATESNELAGPLSEVQKPEGKRKDSAEQFDKWVNGKLTPEEIAALKEGCQKDPSENIFCSTINRGEALEKRIRARNRVPKKPEPVNIRPSEIKIVDGKVQNWKKLKKEPVKSLLKGLLNFQLDDLQVLRKAATKEKKCPNNVAVTVAATLEDFLPDRANPRDIAGLYEKAADCLKKTDSDRETYYTRAGLLQYLNKQYKVASFYFQRATKVPNAYVARPLYWLHRCHQEMNDKKGADAALNQLWIKYPYAFHTLVASTANNRDPGDRLKEAGASGIKRSKKVPALNVLIEQAEILKAGGYDSSAALLAEWAIGESWKAESDIRVYLAQLGDAQTKITIASDIISRNPGQVSRPTLELYFPKAFFPLFEKHSGSLDPFILLSVARQESTLNEKAISPANAQGLLQIHPDTGARVSGGSVDLLDPEQNVTVGARYLSELLNKEENQIHMALAAYNAGEEKLREWVRRYPTSDPILFTDLISYRETRNYVAAVLRNYYWYRRLFSPATDLVTNVIDPSVARR